MFDAALVQTQARAPRKGRARLRLAAALAASALAFAGSADAGVKMTGGTFDLARHSSPNAGQTVSGGAFALNDTIGDVGVQAFAGGSFALAGGLQRQMAQPGSVVAITALSKSTGTLDLTWNAPGLDGFQASVVGFYRLDFSSDPNHAFTPTSFLVEFATAVAPGDAQQLRLTGLLANTTYYSKIYLAGADKFFAEDSRRSDESTLAQVPVNPVLVSVGSTTVTLTYQAPAAAAEGYQADASSTNFISGATLSSVTLNGQLQTLTIAALTPNSTYFLKVASLNWQGDRNYVLLLPIYTAVSGTPLPIVFLINVPKALNRAVSFSWANQPYVNPTGVLVLQSTSAVTTQVASGGGPFAPGQVLGDGSIVKSTTSSVAFADQSLTLDSTYYYHFFSQAQGLQYSVDVTTSVFLDLPPMAPASLAGTPSADLTQLTLAWDAVLSNQDGSAFKSTTTPLGVELASYEISRSTTILSPYWVVIATVAPSVLTYTDTLPNPAAVFLYRVRAMDSLNTADNAMAVDSTGDMYIFSSDQITHMRVPRRSTFELRKGNNAYAAGILIKAVEENGDAAQSIFRSVRFQAARSPDAAPISRFEFGHADTEISLHYDVAGGQVLISSPVVSASGLKNSSVQAGTADSALGMYWDNGAKYVKLFGKVDTLGQTVTVQGPYTGDYQVRGLLRDQGLSFDVSTLSNKFITPNGDGLNDKAVFRFDNPHDSAFSGKIFDVTGSFIADMAPGAEANTLQWDAKANGRVVPGGVYIYQIRGEGKSFSGTLVVVR
jgi:gliding motility-associated-like protein